MKRCPWCEGRKVTGHFVPGENGEAVTIDGQNIPVVAIVDRPCGCCGGKGEITDERHARLTGGIKMMLGDNQNHEPKE